MLERLKAHIFALDEVREWPELRAIFERPQPPTELPFWKYPLAISQAAGGDPDMAAYPAAAVLCLSIGIQLVDDLLDGDLGGVSEGLGTGRAANMAVALHLAAHRIIATSPLSRGRRERCSSWISTAGLGTARGQDLDTVPADSEEAYWRIFEAKSEPLCAAGCTLGGIAAGCSADTVRCLAEIGKYLGRIIQVQDDLSDALAVPRKQDWQRPANNLPILYAMTADHSDRKRFLQLLSSTEQHQDLREAQLILTRCGAVAYCIYYVVESYREVVKLARELPIVDPELLSTFLHRHVSSVESLLRDAGLEAPEDLWVV